MKTGCAPCVKCNFYAKNVKLTGRVEPAEDGGEWHECEPRQFCIQCGETWAWLHVPPKEDLLMPLVTRELETVEKGED